jgi:hypothetical protein
MMRKIVPPPRNEDPVSAWTVWDTREIVARFSSGREAHHACVGTRHVSPDSGRKLCLYDPTGRLAAFYVDGREQIDGLSGSAFPAATTSETNR